MNPLELNSVSAWRDFLQKWSDEWLATDYEFPAAARRKKWLGRAPATAKQITRLERRLGYELPLSYRTFLETTNGFGQTSAMSNRMRPASAVEWLEVEDRALIDAYTGQSQETYDGTTREEYFGYECPVTFIREHFKQSLLIGDPVDGDSLIYVLNPMAVAENGEWEAWLHAHWIPGASRTPSFAHLMVCEYESFLGAVLGRTDAINTQGPYDGVYAPDRPRREAVRIGPGKPPKRRLSVSEHVANLSHLDRKVRAESVKQLQRMYSPHSWNDEQPTLTAECVRIAKTAAEPDVRGAAILMLGSYGNNDAFVPLVGLLQDPDEAIHGAAVSALFYLCVDKKRHPDVGDGLVRFLATPRPAYVTTHALHILEELKDARVGPIALRLMDSNVNLQRRHQAAFLVAQFLPNAQEELLKRFGSPNADVRATAVAAVRQLPSFDTIERVRAMMTDASAYVVQQAEMSLSHFTYVDPEDQPDTAV